MNIRKLKTIKRPTAQEIFIKKKLEIDNMLARLVEANDDHFYVDTDAIDWGHTGDITNYADKLKEITDAVFNEGEYAESNKL